MAKPNKREHKKELFHLLIKNLTNQQNQTDALDFLVYTFQPMLSVTQEQVSQLLTQHLLVFKAHQILLFHKVQNMHGGAPCQTFLRFLPLKST